jgi:hypothetical protein
MSFYGFVGPQVFLLDRCTHQDGHVLVLGATLWTDVMRVGEEHYGALRRGIRDFDECLVARGERFTMDDMEEAHRGDAVRKRWGHRQPPCQCCRCPPPPPPPPRALTDVRTQSPPAARVAGLQEWLAATLTAERSRPVAGGTEGADSPRRVLVITHHPPVQELIREGTPVDSPLAAAEVNVRPDLGTGVDVWVSGHTHVQRQVCGGPGAWGEGGDWSLIRCKRPVFVVGGVYCTLHGMLWCVFTTGQCGKQPLHPWRRRYVRRRPSRLIVSVFVCCVDRSRLGPVPTCPMR